MRPCKTRAYNPIMTLEIPTELEAQLERAARERGTDAHTLLLDAARRLVESAPAAEQEGKNAKRRRLALELRGIAPSGSPTVDEFLRERSEEAQQEALRDEQRWAQPGVGLAS